MIKLTYKGNEFESNPTGRTIEEEAKEIGDRLKYFYMKINGSYDFETSNECQVYPLVLQLIEKIKQDALGRNKIKEEAYNKIEEILSDEPKDIQHKLAKYEMIKGIVNDLKGRKEE